jgi:hypothetical protein
MPFALSFALLRIDPSGELGTSILTIENDTGLSTTNPPDSGEVWTLDGETLSAPQVVNTGQLTALYSGLSDTDYTLNIKHFELDGVDYIFAPFGDTASVVSVTGLTIDAPQTDFFHMSAETELVDGRCLQAEGLEVARDFSTGASTVSVKTMMILDDDPTIQFDGTSGAPLSETGSDAILLHGTTLGPVNASRFDPASDNLTYVEVTYIGTSGIVGSFRALRFAFGSLNDFYIPRPGSVDLSAVAEVTGYTDLGRGLNGRAWADFGLGQNRIDTVLTDADDTYAGQFVNDHVQAGLGKDLVFGNQGEDLLEGGEGKDTLYGGACDDEMDGGSGKDDLYGGASDDDMSGGEDNDLLDGFWGRDTLAGGDGKDDLYGGADDDLLEGGNDDDTVAGDDGADDLFGDKGDDSLVGGSGKDSLDGGKGADTLDGGKGSDELDGGKGDDTLTDGAGEDQATGGDGADVFIMLSDGYADEITDFEDGSDQIDVGVNFGQLVLTDLGPGQVEVAYLGELLILSDKSGLLTAADLTRDDFI